MELQNTPVVSSSDIKILKEELESEKSLKEEKQKLVLKNEEEIKRINEEIKEIAASMLDIKKENDKLGEFETVLKGDISSEVMKKNTIMNKIRSADTKEAEY